RSAPQTSSSGCARSTPLRLLPSIGDAVPRAAVRYRRQESRPTLQRAERERIPPERAPPHRLHSLVRCDCFPTLLLARPIAVRSASSPLLLQESGPGVLRNVPRSNCVGTQPARSPRCLQSAAPASTGSLTPKSTHAGCIRHAPLPSARRRWPVPASDR